MNNKYGMIGIAIFIIAIGSMIVSSEECINPVQRVNWITYVSDMGYNLEGKFSQNAVNIMIDKFSNMCLCFERTGNLPDVYGIVADRWGEEFCFTPGRSKAKTESKINKPVCTTTEKEVCEDVIVCENKCHWKRVCDNWCGHGCHKRCCDYDWKKTCHEECHTEQVCHTETVSSCTS